MPALPSLASVVTSPLLAFRAAALGHCSAAVKLATLRPTERNCVFALNTIRNKQDHLFSVSYEASMGALNGKLAKISQQEHGLFLLEHDQGRWVGAAPSFRQLFESAWTYVTDLHSTQGNGDHALSLSQDDSQRNEPSGFVRNRFQLRNDRIPLSPMLGSRSHSVDFANDDRQYVMHAFHAGLLRSRASSSASLDASLYSSGGQSEIDVDEIFDFSDGEHASEVNAEAVNHEAVNHIATNDGHADTEPAPIYIDLVPGIIRQLPQLSGLKHGKETPFSIPEFAQFEFGIIRTDRR